MSQAEVLNPDKTPAQGIDVVFDPGQVKGRTAANGVVRVTIDTIQNEPLLITVSLTVDFYINVNITYKIITDLMKVLGKIDNWYHHTKACVLNWRQGPMFQNFWVEDKHRLRWRHTHR